MRPGIEDVVFAFLRFPSGLAAHLHLSWLDPHKERRFTVVGSRRMATFDDMDLERKVTIYDKGFDEGADSYGEYITRSGDIHSPRISNSEPLRLEVTHFVDCVREGRTPVSDGESGLRVVRVLSELQGALDESRRGSRRRGARPGPPGGDARHENRTRVGAPEKGARPRTTSGLAPPSHTLVAWRSDRGRWAVHPPGRGRVGALAAAASHGRNGLRGGCLFDLRSPAAKIEQTSLGRPRGLARRERWGGGRAQPAGASAVAAAATTSSACSRVRTGLIGIARWVRASSSVAGRLDAGGVGAHRRLAVDRGAVVAAVADVGGGEGGLEGRHLGAAHDVQVPCGLAARDRARERHERAEAGGLVVGAGRPASGRPGLELLELDAQDRRLQLVEARVVADELVG